METVSERDLTKKYSTRNRGEEGKIASNRIKTEMREISPRNAIISLGSNSEILDRYFIVIHVRSTLSFAGPSESMEPIDLSRPKFLAS